MPLVTIDLLEGRPPHELDAIADAIHEAMVDHLGVPRRAARRRPGIPAENVAIALIENTREDWSFGRGRPATWSCLASSGVERGASTRPRAIPDQARVFRPLPAGTLEVSRG